MEFDVNEMVKITGATFVAVLVMSFALIKIVRLWNVDKAGNNKDGAEAILYQHLSEQVTSLANSLDASRVENSKMLNELSSLKTRIMHLEGVEGINAKLKEKLDLKDCEILALSKQVVETTSALTSVTKTLTDTNLTLDLTKKELLIIQDQVKAFEAKRLPYGISSFKS